MALILIVDDHAEMRLVLSTLMKRGGHRTMAVRSGEGGVNAALTASPDLIILDWMLPDKDGLEVLRDLRATASTRRIPVIICSSKSDPLEIAEARAAGADDYWVKGSFDPSEASTRVSQMLLAG